MWLLFWKLKLLHFISPCVFKPMCLFYKDQFGPLNTHMLIWDNFSNAVKSNVCVLQEDPGDSQTTHVATQWNLMTQTFTPGLQNVVSMTHHPFTFFHFLSVFTQFDPVVWALWNSSVLKYPSLVWLSEAFNHIFCPSSGDGVCHLSWRWFSCYHVIEVIRDGRIKAGGQSFVQRSSLRSDVNGHSIVHWLSVNDLWLIPTQCDWLCLFGSCRGMDVLTVLAGENILGNQSPM